MIRRRRQEANEQRARLGELGTEVETQGRGWPLRRMITPNLESGNVDARPKGRSGRGIGNGQHNRHLKGVYLTDKGNVSESPPASCSPLGVVRR